MTQFHKHLLEGKDLLTSGIESAGVLADFFFSVAFCFVKHRINLIKSVSFVELPAGINMKKLQQQFQTSLKIKIQCCLQNHFDCF